MPVGLLIFISISIIVITLIIIGGFKGVKSQMKYRFVTLLIMPFLAISCTNESKYNITESTFFLVMTNIQYYPEEYLNKDITFDCFTYELESTSGEKYLCAVRKCSSGFGCKCGKDTIIGFIVSQDIGLPEPKNQYEDTNEKAWIHVTGQITSIEKTVFNIYGTDDIIEEVQFLSFEITDFSLIEDYSKLHYYVTK